MVYEQIETQILSINGRWSVFEDFMLVNAPLMGIAVQLHLKVFFSADIRSLEISNNLIEKPFYTCCEKPEKRVGHFLQLIFSTLFFV